MRKEAAIIVIVSVATGCFLVGLIFGGVINRPTKQRHEVEMDSLEQSLKTEMDGVKSRHKKKSASDQRKIRSLEREVSVNQQTIKKLQSQLETLKSKTTSPPAQPQNTETIDLQKAFAYLLEVEEVAWFSIVKNTIYIGFKNFPRDGELIVKGAALKGNKLTNFGFHAWAVPADQKENSPYHGTMSGKYYKEATARYGKIE